MAEHPDSPKGSGEGHRFTIDLNAWPCASYGTLRFDIPRAPCGTLKKALRGFLRRFPDIQAAYLLLASRPEWGDAPHVTVPLLTERDLDPVCRAWEAERPEEPPIWFLRVGNNPVSQFACWFAAPFYVRETPELPAPFPTAELIALIQGLPETPFLAATSDFLETLKENYDHLAPEEAEAEYRAQDLEKEQLLQELRLRSRHREAKNALLHCLREKENFSLLLRTFEREVASGSSGLTGGRGRVWLSERPLERHIARVTPLQLIGIANPRDPFPSSLLLEVGEDWPRVVVSLVARAAAIFVVCDRLSPGIVTELLAVRGMGREDDTLIIVPPEEGIEKYKAMHFLSGASTSEPPEPAALVRKLATFGVVTTSKEFMEQPPYNG